MSPRFLWFFLGAGVGAWWATNKKVNVDCRVHRTVAPSPVYPQQPSAAASEPSRQHNHDWEEERVRIRQFSQSAGDTIAELSEVTLSTILQATEALKARMAEHRALRDAERRMEEERYRNPTRLV